MENLIYVESPSLETFLYNFPRPENGNINLPKFGELVNKYFSFQGTYEILNKDPSSITLRKLKDEDKLEIPSYSEIIVPANLTELEALVNDSSIKIAGRICHEDFKNGVKLFKSGLMRKNYGIHILFFDKPFVTKLPSSITQL